MTRTETIKLPVSCGYVPLSLDPFDDAEEWRIVDADGVVVAWDDVIAALNATATAPTPDLTALGKAYKEYQVLTKFYRRGDVDFGAVVAGAFHIVVAVDVLFREEKDSTPDLAGRRGEGEKAIEHPTHQ